MVLKEQKVSKTVKRTILLNPGPSTTTETVKASLIQDDICHREEEFAQIVRGICDDLVKVVHGKSDYSAVLFAGSGTIIIDVALNSLVPDGKKVLVLNNGAYSQRGVDVCKYFRIPVIDMKIDILDTPDLALVEKTLKENPDIAVVFTAHQETGTGLLNPIREIGALSRKYKAIFVTDSTSTYGVMPMNVYDDNIDFCMASSQKGLNAFTGLSFIVGKTSEIEKTKDYQARSYYTNLWRQYDFFKKNKQMHFTPPVQIMYSLAQALKEHFAEGEQAKWKRFRDGYKVIREEMAKLGFKDILPEDKQTGLVVGILNPKDPNFDFNKIHDYLYEKGVTIYPGKIADLETFRVCNLGSLGPDDIRDAFKVLTDALKACGVALPVKY
ncbi:MAG: 2-aminoethylphosphonate--pyruvate transaminase [Spirochaetaceae bacterium]|nr:2-aminoethylphosphonate--pyruvate transaminase [Spirochaetaceae bacterium]